jgi:hypothetical protein
MSKQVYDLHVEAGVGLNRTGTLADAKALSIRTGKSIWLDNGDNGVVHPAHEQHGFGLIPYLTGTYYSRGRVAKLHYFLRGLSSFIEFQSPIIINTKAWKR